MSPSKREDTDRPPNCGFLHPVSIEYTKWCRGPSDTPQQNTKSGEVQKSGLSENEDSIRADPSLIPLLSSNSSRAPTSNDPPSSPRRNMYIRLADESPRRESEHSDSCTYDSFNNQETDVCHDSSDTDSSSSGEIIKTIEVEYDVASISSKEALFTGDSSSGTDGNMFPDTYASIESEQEYSSALADIECLPSDDSELTAADYWTCSKCKNKNNNPRFHCCEKCYQIRRSHYPPRPRRRRSRRVAPPDNSLPTANFSKSWSERTRKLSRQRRRTSLSSNPTSSCEPSTSKKHSPTELQSLGETSGRCMVGISKNRLNAADSSSDESFVSRRSYSEFKRSRVATKRKIEEDEIETAVKRLRSDKTEITLTPNEKDIETDLPFSQTTEVGIQISQKDSGFSSFSSQESKSTNSEPQHYDDDTVSEELDEKDVFDMTKDQNSILSPLDIESKSSDMNSSLSLRMCSEPIIKSMKNDVSDCSLLNLQKEICGALTKMNGTNDQQTKQTTGNDPDYGLCMTCSNEPKNGVFVHSRFLHLCCCYKCAVKIWNKNQRCPICNCAVKNVLKLFVY